MCSHLANLPRERKCAAKVEAPSHKVLQPSQCATMQPSSKSTKVPPDKQFGEFGEQEVRARLERALCATGFQFSGFSDKGIDLFVQFESTAPDRQPLHYGVQVKTGDSFVKPHGSHWLVTNLPDTVVNGPRCCARVVILSGAEMRLTSSSTGEPGVQLSILLTCMQWGKLLRRVFDNALVFLQPCTRRHPINCRRTSLSQANTSAQ